MSKSIIYLITIIFISFGYSSDYIRDNKVIDIFSYDEIKVNSKNIIINKTTSQHLDGKIDVGKTTSMIIKDGLVSIIDTKDMTLYFSQNQISKIKMNTTDFQLTINKINNKMTDFSINNHKNKTFIKYDNNESIIYIKEIQKDKNKYGIFSDYKLNFYSLKDDTLITFYNQKWVIKAFVKRHDKYSKGFDKTLMESLSYDIFLNSLKFELEKDECIKTLGKEKYDNLGIVYNTKDFALNICRDLKDKK